MLIVEDKRRPHHTQRAAIAEAIRTTPLVRHKASRRWMDGRGVGHDDRPALGAQWAQDDPLAARLNALARQAAADRAGASSSRFSTTCRAHKPGHKGSPRVQPANRAVESKTSGGRWEPDGTRRTVTEGLRMGTGHRMGLRSSATVPLAHIQRGRRVKRAAGGDVPCAVPAARHIPHEPSGKPVGIAGGLKSFSTASDGHMLATPRDRRTAEQRLKRRHRRVARTLTRAQHRKTASTRLATGSLRVHRQRTDGAVKAASTLVQSRDSGAFEDVPMAHRVKNPHLATRIRDASGGRFRSGVRYDAQGHGSPVRAVPARFTTQDGSGCGSRVKKSRSLRTPMGPHGGLVLDRDGNAALTMLAAAWVLVAGLKRTAGQADTGRLRTANAAGQRTSGGRQRLRSAKLAG
jgi:putative transposase